jgi:hypothetical protein
MTITLQCGNDQDQLHDIWQLDSPSKLEPLGGGRQKGTMVTVFLFFLL